MCEKTVLITGASGYVPAYFVHTFMARNKIYNNSIHVIALCRNIEKAKICFKDYLDSPAFSLLIQDVCLPIVTDRKIDYIIHAASPAGIIDRHKKPCDTFNANVLGCYNSLKIAHQNQVSAFLMISSVDAYGKLSSNQRLDETQSGQLDPLDIKNAYSNAKRACETLCLCENVQNQIPTKIARPFQIIGPGAPLTDGRLHIDFIAQILKSDQIVLKGDGTAKRSFLYITDAILGLLHVLLLGQPGQVYNIVDEQGEATVLELAKLMASSMKNQKVEVTFDHSKRNTPEVKHAISCVTGASSKLRNLGWIPQMKLEDAIGRLCSYYTQEFKEKN